MPVMISVNVNPAKYNHSFPFGLRDLIMVNLFLFLAFPFPYIYLHKNMLMFSTHKTLLCLEQPVVDSNHCFSPEKGAS